ncbi:unnamed protein product [Lactuca virosa]|uniref:Ubiquitin-like protease family profile domain-containing protein n=1 Tax=Lactuca virosa TaxID=75947 RepID=A0AAU9M0X3_9ASTR|nr:unnamed protein product [Lactuca virosa]
MSQTKRFVEEEEEMINEEDEEPYYHDTQFDYGGLEENVKPTPTHGEPSQDVGEHYTKIVTPIGRPQRKRVVAWYQRTPFTVMQSTAKLKKISKTRKKKIEESPKKTNEDIVNAESSDVSNHLLLDSIYTNSPMSFWKEWSVLSSKLITKHRLHILPLDMDFWSRLLSVTDKGWLLSSVLFVINVISAHWFMAVLHLDTWKVEIYDSARIAGYFSKYLTGGEFTSFGDSIISELDVIEYWNHFPVGHKDKAKLEFVDVVDVPQQEYSLDRGDCRVFVCMFMEMIVSGVPVKISTARRDAGFLYINKMTNVIWDTI